MARQTAVEGVGVRPRRRSRLPAPVALLLQPYVYLPIVFLVVFLLAWEIYGRGTNPLLFAPPTEVAKAAAELISTGVLQEALVTTLTTLAVGLVLAIVTGLLFGIALGRYPKLAEVVEPYIDGIYATPRVVLSPLVILWFGIGFAGRVFIIWIGTVIPLILATAIGVRHARPDLIEVGRSFQASERDLIRHVILPGAVPYVLAGLRIAMGRALIGVVIAEMFLDLTGVGGLIREAAARFRVPEVLTGVLVFSLLGTTLIGFVSLLERRFQGWKTDAA